MTSTPRPGASADVKASLIARINKLEGQVRGIRRMVEEERPCVDTLQQIASLRSAAGAIGLALLEAYIRECASSAVNTGRPEGVARETALALRRCIRS
jgi:DNA-binding FrmR family transcriptional regulator